MWRMCRTGDGTSHQLYLHDDNRLEYRQFATSREQAEDGSQVMEHSRGAYSGLFRDWLEYVCERIDDRLEYIRAMEAA